MNNKDNTTREVFCEIDSKTAIEFLLPRHYSGRKPQISVAFAIKIENEIKAVVTFGKPASPSLCVGVCGKENSKYVYELNRLCRTDDYKRGLSFLVAKSLRTLKSRNMIIVSYADTGMNHNGYVYQACNFIYTGKTKSRTDKYTEGNRHPRHYNNQDQNGLRKVRTSKHRYIYFCTNSKVIKNQWIKNLKYSIEKYPKGQNKNYTLGDFQKPEIVKQIVNKSVDSENKTLERGK